MPIPHRSAPATAGAWLLLCAFLLCLAVHPGFSQAGTTPVLNPANGHYYQRISMPGGIPWRDAYTAAADSSYQGLPGHLVTITSAAENQFIIANLGIAAAGDHWIGGYRQPAPPGGPTDGWQWIT